MDGWFSVNTDKCGVGNKWIELPCDTFVFLYEWYLQKHGG